MIQPWFVRHSSVKRGHPWSVALVLALLVGWAWALDVSSQTRAPREPAVEPEPVVVTATAAPTPLGRTTAPVTVISREQIEAHGVRASF